MIRGLINGFVAMLGTLWSWYWWPYNKIMEVMSGAGGWLYNVGRNLIQGFINGIASMLGALGNMGSNIASTVANKVKGFLGIHSPSKLFAEFGSNVVAGFTGGIEDNLSNVSAISDKLNVGITTPHTSGGNTSTTTSSINFNAPISLGNSEAVNTFFDRLNRNNELARKGLATL
jgi:phage-related protein